MEATSIGSGEMGVTLKRRRILASRSCTERMPAPHSPLPRIPITSTVATKYAMPWPVPAWNSSANAKKKMNGKQEIEEQHGAVAHGEPHVVTE